MRGAYCAVTRAGESQAAIDTATPVTWQAIVRARSDPRSGRYSHSLWSTSQKPDRSSRNGRWAATPYGVVDAERHGRAHSSAGPWDQPSSAGFQFHVHPGLRGVPGRPGSRPSIAGPGCREGTHRQWSPLRDCEQASRGRDSLATNPLEVIRGRSRVCCRFIASSRADIRSGASSG